jgi:hypothetical protein
LTVQKTKENKVLVRTEIEEAGLMVVLGVVVAAVAAFVASSAYYAAATPVERRVLGDAAMDRGRPGPGKIGAELVRTMVVAAVFAGIAARAHDLAVPGAFGLALAAWLAFPVVLLTGSVMLERVAPVTAAMHAGDWLLKLALIAVAIGLLH